MASNEKPTRCAKPSGLQSYETASTNQSISAFNYLKEVLALILTMPISRNPHVWISNPQSPAASIPARDRMIELTIHEVGLVVEALVPDFRVNGRGQSRGPAIYRSGNNTTALAITLKNGGRFFDRTTVGGK
jgi:hypothetical protein